MLITYPLTRSKRLDKLTTATKTYQTKQACLEAMNFMNRERNECSRFITTPASPYCSHRKYVVVSLFIYTFLHIKKQCR